VMHASRRETISMNTDFEFDGCLQPGSGMAEALDAAGVDCHAPTAVEQAASAAEGGNT